MSQSSSIFNLVLGDIYDERNSLRDQAIRISALAEIALKVFEMLNTVEAPYNEPLQYEFSSLRIFFPVPGHLPTHMHVEKFLYIEVLHNELFCFTNLFFITNFKSVESFQGYFLSRISGTNFIQNLACTSPF